MLSKSLNYFSTISPEELSASFVHNAIVTVSDGSKTVQLVEYNYKDSGGFEFYYYTVDFTNASQHVIWQIQYNIQFKNSVGRIVQFTHQLQQFLIAQNL